MTRVTLADLDARRPTWPTWLTRVAFGGALILAVARAMLPHYLRDVVPIAPLASGEVAPPRAAGPAVGTLLDAACICCALLVFLRAALDRSYSLRRTWSVAVLAILALYAFASTLWASDKFAAAASSSTWVAAAALVFTFAQTVRTWSRFRVVAAAAAGLFLVNVGFGVVYRAVDLPDLRDRFQHDKAQIFAERGWEADSPAARQFENRWMKGQTGGFAASPNSYAALLVLLGFALGGVAWQRWRDGEERNWGLVLALGFLPGLWIFYTTGSRAAAASAGLFLFLLLAVWPLRGLVVRKRSAVFVLVAAVVALGVATVVGIGLVTGTLPQDSLAFRWNYWVGAWGVWRDHPLRGVGFANFGDAYLLHRPPVAAEEVKDPHDLFVRFFAETGVIGGLLAVAWVGATGWELMRKVKPTADEPRLDAAATPTAKTLAWVVVLAMAVNVLAGVDLGSDPGFVFLELFRRGLFAALLAVGLLMGSVRSATDARLSNRPAGAAAAAIVAGLLAVVLHATADVVLFEPPVLMSFALLLGATLGIRAPEANPSPAARWASAGATAAGLAVFLLAFSLPLTVAEVTAGEGDDLVRANRPGDAVRAYLDAADWSPVSNADYYRRAAAASLYARRPAAEAEALLRRARAADPAGIDDLVTLANLYRRSFAPPRDADAAAALAEATARNPNDLQIRTAYADALEASGQPAEAAEQLRRVLEFNDQLNADEPERLPPSQVEAINTRIRTLDPSR